nr:site-specific DNA-methyltransferase [Pseudoxanthomonas sp. PXM05]
MEPVYVGDCREVLPMLPAGFADCCITDPPYGDTSLDWDVICKGWIPHVARALKPAASIWVFGSMRFLAPLFAEMATHGFRYSQDIVWEKQNGSGFHNDRFRRVHEHAVMFYRGAWQDVYHEAQFTNDARKRVVRKKAKPAQWHGPTGSTTYVSEDGGPRLARSVMQVRNEHGRAIHPTQKPVELLRPMVRYSCPPGGRVLDCFAGSGSTAIAAAFEGRQYTIIESDPGRAELMRKHICGGPLFQSEVA